MGLRSNRVTWRWDKRTVLKREILRGSGNHDPPLSSYLRNFPDRANGHRAGQGKISFRV